MIPEGKYHTHSIDHRVVKPEYIDFFLWFLSNNCHGIEKNKPNPLLGSMGFLDFIFLGGGWENNSRLGLEVNWKVPKHGTIQAVRYIKEGAPWKLTDTQSSSQNCQPMILVVGAYLRDCTLQCRSQSVESHSRPVVAVVWYWQVVQHYQQ